MAIISNQEDTEKRVKALREEAHEEIKNDDSKKSPDEIVIIDDDSNYIKAIKRQLVRNGYNVVAFEIQEEAFRYNFEKTDLILCDVLMPGMNGFEVLKGIRSDKKNQYIPFVFLSGSKIEHEEIFKAFDSDVTDFISKTSSEGELLGRVKRALKEGRLISERNRAEKALQESEEFSSSLLDNSLTPILVVNQDTSIEYANPSFEALAGFTSAEIIGKKPPYPWWITGQKSGNLVEVKKNIILRIEAAHVLTRIY